MFFPFVCMVAKEVFGRNVFLISFHFWFSSFSPCENRFAAMTFGISQSECRIPLYGSGKGSVG
jgi:hypothetical protein